MGGPISMSPAVNLMVLNHQGLFQIPFISSYLINACPLDCWFIHSINRNLNSLSQLQHTGKLNHCAVLFTHLFKAGQADENLIFQRENLKKIQIKTSFCQRLFSSLMLQFLYYLVRHFHLGTVQRTSAGFQQDFSH